MVDFKVLLEKSRRPRPYVLEAAAVESWRGGEWDALTFEFTTVDEAVEFALRPNIHRLWPSLRVVEIATGAVVAE